MATTDIFYWQPNYNEITSGLNFKTLVTQFDSGAEQRRSKWATPKYNVSLKFNQYDASRGAVRAIWEFYTARKGKFDWFWLPSFKHDTKLTADAASGQAIIDVEDASRFTSVVDTHGNYVYITDGFTTREIKQIDSISNNQLTLAANLTNTYTVSTAKGQQVWVEVAYKVRFASDDYIEDNFVDFAFNTGITFVEVFFPDN